MQAKRKIKKKQFGVVFFCSGWNIGLSHVRVNFLRPSFLFQSEVSLVGGIYTCILV